MATIYHQVGIQSSIENTFNAIATLEGISNWWTPTTGTPSLNGSLSFIFGEHSVSANVTKHQNQQSITWTVTGEPGEWLDTEIRFALVETDKQILVNFEHANWENHTDMFSHCSTKWAVFLVSLKQYLETGTGRPFPNDTEVNHY